MARGCKIIDKGGRNQASIIAPCGECGKVFTSRNLKTAKTLMCRHWRTAHHWSEQQVQEAMARPTERPRQISVVGGLPATHTEGIFSAVNYQNPEYRPTYAGLS